MVSPFFLSFLQLQVDSAIGRDVCPSETGDILRVLSSWSSACEGVLNNIETQILRANQHKDNNVRLKSQIETEVANIKKTLVKVKSLVFIGDFPVLSTGSQFKTLDLWNVYRLSYT